MKGSDLWRPSKKYFGVVWRPTPVMREFDTIEEVREQVQACFKQHRPCDFAMVNGDQRERVAFAGKGSNGWTWAVESGGSITEQEWEHD